MDNRTKKYAPWFTLDMAVFVIANILLLQRHDVINVFSRLTFLQLIVLGLASYRVANIISNETITKPLRAPFVNEEIKGGKIVEEPKPEGFRGAMGKLIYCPSCTGVWIAGLFAYGYVFLPTEISVLALLFALSALERFLAFSLGRLKRVF